MITICIALDYTDLMEDETEKEESTKESMLDNIKAILENAILSSLEDAKIVTPTGPKRVIRGTTQRDADRILDAIEAVKPDGKLVMSLKRMVKFQDLWSGRLSAPAGGNNRKLMQRIDRIICPDEYKKDEDADDATADE